MRKTESLVTSNACEAYKKTGGKRAYIFAGAVNDDGKEIERPMELLPSHYASPEDVVIALREQERLRALLDVAAARIKDPRHLEAVVLHVVEGMPIASDDPEKKTLMKYFDATLGEAQYYLKAGLSGLRRALQELGVHNA